jgi:hypothetical protein
MQIGERDHEFLDDCTTQIGSGVVHEFWWYRARRRPVMSGGCGVGHLALVWALRRVVRAGCAASCARARASIGRFR